MKLLFAAVLLFISTQLFAQSSRFPVITMELQTTPLSTDSTMYNAKMLINLYDTTAVASINVKLGSSIGAGDLVTRTFIFDTGASGYSRNGYDVTLDLGDFQNLIKFYSEVTIERAEDHSLSAPIIYSRL